MSGENRAIMEMVNVERAIEWQAAHAEQNGAPMTGRLIRAFLALLENCTECGDRMRNWPGLLLEDAMPLRLAGGFHNLHLTGTDERLKPIYSGEVTDQAQVDAIVLAVARDHDFQLAQWFAGPPQTNEAGRSAGIMAGLLWLAQRLGSRFELNEIGASAGINTMMERYAYDLGGIRVGPQDSRMRIIPEWRGPPPPQEAVEIVSIRGCDVGPIDLTDQGQALRLKSYVWAEVTERLDRVDAAIALASERPPLLEMTDAADWVESRLAEPQAKGVTRVLYHSIVWQYLPPESRSRIEHAMNEAGARAGPERPLAWVQLETNRETFRHELRVRYWPGSREWALLGEAHAHGAWVTWFGS